jgi:CubicO group peptidase (beta-lactamase class C family)
MIWQDMHFEAITKIETRHIFNYSDGSVNILQLIMRRTLGDENYYRFPYELFYKTGMRNTLIEPDASGTFVGSSYVYATARDWARFGPFVFAGWCMERGKDFAGRMGEILNYTKRREK